MANTAALPILLKELRLHAIGQQWESLAQQASDKDWSPQEYLATLCEEEMALRYQKRIQRYTREAKLPPGKSLKYLRDLINTQCLYSMILVTSKNQKWKRKSSLNSSLTDMRAEH